MPDFSIRNSVLARAASVLIAVLIAPRMAGANTYALITPPSALESGCFGPCACPIMETPTYGSFELVYTGSDPLYTYYDVQRFIASFNNGPGAVTVVGAGKFRIGGEFALMQQMTLDLMILGGPVQHFDSGLVPAGASFPAIRVSAALHGFSCTDSVMSVDATPTDVAGNPGTQVHPGIQAVWPNPSSGEARVAFALTQAGPLTIRVMDLEGGRVRDLVRVGLAAAGSRTITWDGRRDDGRSAPAGVYWVVMSWSGGTARRRIARLE
jgi:hypothetical protein